jgi:hypothetical protein
MFSTMFVRIHQCGPQGYRRLAVLSFKNWGCITLEHVAMSVLIYLVGRGCPGIPMSCHNKGFHDQTFVTFGKRAGHFKLI